MSDPEKIDPAEVEKKSRSRPWTKWRYLRWTGRIVGLVILGVLAAAYLARGWLTDRATVYIEERLRNKNIHIEHGEISYELGRGVVLRELVIFETEAKERPVLKISNLGFDLGLDNLLSGEAVDVKTAQLSVEDAFLEVFAGEKVAEIANVQFQGESTPERVEILAAEGAMNGLVFRAKGNVWKKPKELKIAENGEGELGDRAKERKKLNLSWVGAIARLIDLESNERAPQLKVTFDVDKREGAAEPIRVVGNFSGSNCRWKGLPLDQADGDFTVTWSDKLVDVSRAKIVYRGKPIEGKLRYNLDAKMLEVEQLASEADLISLLGEQPIDLGEKLKGFRFSEPPRLIFTGQVPVEDPKATAAEVTCEREGAVVIGQSEKALTIQLIEGVLRYRGGTVNSEKFSVGLFGGLANVAGGINLAEKPITYETGIAFAGMPLQTIMASLGKESKYAGVVTGTFAGVGGFSFESIEGTGEFTLEGDDFKIFGPISLNQAVVASNGLEANFGGGLLSASGTVNTAISPVVFETNAGFEAVSMQSLLTFMGSEKKMAGSLSGSFKGSGSNSLASVGGDGEIRFDNGIYQIEGPFAIAAGVVESENLTIALGGGKIGVQGKTNVAELPIVFEGRVLADQVPVQSILDVTGSDKKAGGILSGSFEGSGGKSVESVAGRGEIRYDAGNYQIEGPFAINAGVVASDSLTVALGGGRIGLQGKANVVEVPKVFEGQVQIEKVSIQSIIDLTGSDREVEGNVFGQFKGTFGNSLAGVKGAGAVQVQDGKLYSVPVIGQTRSFLANVLPVFGKVEKSNLQGSFAIDQGILTTHDLVAASDMTRVEVDGILNFNDMTAEFTAQAKVDGVVGVATDVVSGILEVEADGPVSNLDIRLKNNAAGMAAGAVKGTVGAAKTGVSELTQGAKNVGGTAVRAGTKGVKKVGEVGAGIGKLILGKKKDSEKGKPDEEPSPPVPLPATPSATPVEPAPEGDPAEPAEPAPQQ